MIGIWICKDFYAVDCLPQTYVQFLVSVLELNNEEYQNGKKNDMICAPALPLAGVNHVC